MSDEGNGEQLPEGGAELDPQLCGLPLFSRPGQARRQPRRSPEPRFGELIRRLLLVIRRCLLPWRVISCARTSRAGEELLSSDTGRYTSRV